MTQTSTMCLHPSLTENGYVACRTCWRCISNKVNEKVGRMIAESKTSLRTIAVTLTYKTQTIDDMRPLMFHPQDVTLFMKNVRKRYGATRYVICGEKGTLKGRVHFHAILFFQDQNPDLITDQRIDWKPWPHGYSFIQEATPDALKYVLKYAVKESMDQNDKNSDRFRPRYSLKPPLGHTYLQNEAIRMAQAGIKPKNNLYFFQENRDKKYLMSRTTRDNFLDTYTRVYQDIWGKWPHCDVVDDHYEDELIENEIYEPTRYNPDIHKDYMATPYTIKAPRAILPNLNPFELQDILRNVYGLSYQGIPTILVTEPDGSTITSEASSWHANPALTKRILRDAQIQWRVSFNEFKNNPPPDPVSVIVLQTTEPPF